MLNQLKDNLETIYNELNDKLLPSNIRSGVTIFGVEGVLEQVSSPYTIEDTLITNYTVTKPDSGSYTFALNSNNYYESNNKGVQSSYALAKITFTAPRNDSIFALDCISYGENNYDYGLLSNLDTTLSSNNTVDNSSMLYYNFYGKASTNVVRITYTGITAGEHFIYVKYRKDGSADSGYDSFQFKVVERILKYQNVKIYGSLEAMNNDITQLDGTYATIDNGKQQFINIYRFNANTIEWVLTQSTEFTAGQYSSTTAFKNDSLHYGSNYVGIILEPNVLLPLNFYKEGETKLENFKDEVVLSTPLTPTETYHIDNLLGTNDDYWARNITADLTYTSFRLEMYNEMGMEGGENYILEYVSTDGETYLQTRNTFYETPYIRNDNWTRLKGNWDSRFGDFMFYLGNKFGGLYYKTNATNSPSTYRTQLYGSRYELPNNLTVYTQEGVVSGELYTPLTNTSPDYLRYKLNVYDKLRSILEDKSQYENGLLLHGYEGSRLAITEYDDIDSISIENCINLSNIDISADNVAEGVYISRNSGLTNLHLDLDNVTSNINIDNNINLVTTNINVNNITNLIYITNNTSLTTLILSGNYNYTTFPQITNNSSLTSIDISNLTFNNNITSMYQVFSNTPNLVNYPNIVTSYVTNWGYTFRGNTNLTAVVDYDYSTGTTFNYTFYGCTNLVDLTDFNINSPITNVGYMFYNCSSLVDIPQFDLTGVTSYGGYQNWIGGCTSLSSESLNKVLYALSRVSTSITSNRTLKYVGFTNEQVTTAQSLSNYAACINAGWTTGY